MLALAFALIAFPAIAGESSPTPAPLLVADEMRMTAYTTGYSYWDNTPPGGADISNGVIHTKAGGMGTFKITITRCGRARHGGRQRHARLCGGHEILHPNLKRYLVSRG